MLANAGLLLALAAQVSLTEAFTITFYLGSKCRGAMMSQVNKSRPWDQDVCFDAPVNAQSAIVQRDSVLDGDHHFVSFWSDGCGGVLEASGNGNCIDFSPATSYSIQDYNLDPHWRKLRSRDDTETKAVENNKAAAKTRASQPAWLAEQNTRVSSLGGSADEMTGSLSSSFDPDRLASMGRGHGNVSLDGEGRTVRWRQVALGVTVGIPVDEWDDEVHTLSDRFVGYSDTYSDGFETDATDALAAARSEPTCPEGDATCENAQAAALRTLDRRQEPPDWYYQSCRATIDCTREVLGGSVFYIHAAWRQVINCANAVRGASEPLAQYCRDHFVSCTVVNWVGGAIVSYGLGQIKTGGEGAEDGASGGRECTSGNLQADAFIEGMLSAADAGEANEAKIDITLEDGKSLLLWGNVYPENAVPNNPFCPAQ
ncbi:hypothetical protein CSOJ01_04571 [Colletotrichum sojae]|uniref:Ecp2 effector protein domain-containing protein n=1 Tax=Colletotrichum sojae TaxID=2175907 RepID=A0A8H6JHZ6_9PEZI|nr:hypothetical protein CSOJ01_04571 [Colletotrichum sojae]